MAPSRQAIGQIVRALGTIGMALLAAPQVARCQVGITSGLAQVALVASVAPRGSIQNVSGLREREQVGPVREASVTVRMSANTGYRLIVKTIGPPVGRVWVRSVTGDFQELTAGSSVTVAWDTRGAGEWEREVQYRIETQESAGTPYILPVRYEMSISPQL